MRRARSIVAALAVLVPLLVAFRAPVPEAAAAADGGSPGNEWTWSETYLPSEDGTMLHADVFLPADRAADDRHPVILSIGPYFGTSSTSPAGPTLRFADLMEEGRIFERGYAYVQVDLRGFGGSAGCFDLGGPGEQMDAKAAVEWAAQQPWSTGRVGMWGKSYDAWTQVMALAGDPDGLEAVVIQSPLIEAYRGMWHNGLHYATGWWIIGVTYTTYDAPPNYPTTNDEAIWTAESTVLAPTCTAQNTTQTQAPVHETPWYLERDLIARAGDSDAAVLWSHGFNDVNTKPDNFLPVWESLSNPENRAWVGQWAHDRGNEVDKIGRDGFMQEAMLFFAEHLQGIDGADDDLPAVEAQDADGVWRSEYAWPPADAVGHTFDVLPGSYADARSGSASSSTGSWTFSPVAEYEVRTAGTVHVSVDVVADHLGANVVANLYDMAPDGEATMVSRGGAVLFDGAPTVDGFAGTVTFDLFPQDHLLRAGHRYALKLSGNDSTLFFPTNSGRTVDVAGGTWTIPALAYARTSDLTGTRAQAQDGVAVVYLDAGSADGRTPADATMPPPAQER